MTTDEEKISSLYQQGKDQVPPAHLDSAILNAAHDAVDGFANNKPAKDPSASGRSAAVKSPFSGGWPAITSIAAVLIITVILVPLIDKETPPPASSRFADETEATISEADAFSRVNRYEDDIEEKQKAKKHSKAEAPALLLQEHERLQAPQDSMSADVLNADKVLPAEKSSAEAPMTTMRATIKTQVPATSIMPESASKTSTVMQDENSALEAETMQQTSGRLMAEQESTVILTAAEWLKKISQFIDHGDLDLAKQEFEKFKIHYPDEEVDPLILNQLKNQ